MKEHCYITSYTNVATLFDFDRACSYVHYASSLPEAIKNGRAFVRDLNRSEGCRPGMKHYHYETTYRAR